MGSEGSGTLGILVYPCVTLILVSFVGSEEAVPGPRNSFTDATKEYLGLSMHEASCMIDPGRAADGISVGKSARDPERRIKATTAAKPELNRYNI